MWDSLIVPLFVTTDLPPRAELAEFGELLVEAVRTLGHDGDRRDDLEDGGYDAFLAGGVFWLDRPVLSGQRPASETESRFAGLLGHLTAVGGGHTPQAVLADVRRAVGAAVLARYGDAATPPAVFAIRDRDVRERTPASALRVDTRDTRDTLGTRDTRAPSAELVAAVPAAQPGSPVSA